MNDNLFGLKSCCAITVNLNGKKCPVCRTNLPYRIKAADLRMGDVIIPHPMSLAESYVQSTVTQITETGVQLFRIYVSTSDFTCTGGVIPYIGFEQYTISLDNEVYVIRESSVTDVRIAETDEGRILRAGGKIARTPDGGLVRVNS